MRGTYSLQTCSRVVLIEGGHLFNLAKHINKKMKSSIHKEQECKVAKFKHMKLEVMQLKIKIKHKLPSHE